MSSTSAGAASAASKCWGWPPCARSGRSCGSARRGQCTQVSCALAQSLTLAELVAMREQLQQLCKPSGASGDQLVADLQAWLKMDEQRVCSRIYAVGMARSASAWALRSRPTD
ncbi:DesA/ISL3 alpha bundle tail domain-containing protein [Rhodoferax antarcticus]|uniref:DesA/ISL3 alpha bundle tail domain-containing protein n=1 Tax=Rhodoferax antarcticus TaxID=81479 RepID=UPI003B84710F